MASLWRERVSDLAPFVAFQDEPCRSLRRGEFMNVQRREASKMPGVCREQRQTQDGGACGYEAIGNTHAIGKVKLFHPDICSIPDFP